MTLKLMSHELIDFLKQPPLLMLVVLPIMMSVMVISFMNEPGLELMLLPSWILFAQVMVGLMIIAPGFIEEKEQKTLDALLISPLSLREVIRAKASVILIFSLLSQLFVYLLNLGFTSDLFGVFVFMVIGGILFIQVGLVVGLLLHSSKTSAALSSIIMVVLFMTATFYPQLPEWHNVLQFIPSVVVVENMNGVFNGEFLGFELALLIGWLAVFYGIIQYLVKKELSK